MKSDKLYVISRRDLPPGVQAAQSVHAITEFSFEYPEIFREWYENSNYICILASTDENELIKLSERLKKKEVKHSIFREPDLNNELTAIAIEPGRDSKKACSSYPLALKEYSLGGRR